MSFGVAIAVGVLLGGAVLVAAFEVADRFELNLFQVGDAA
jgi:hypothetical protein